MLGLRIRTLATFLWNLPVVRVLFRFSFPLLFTVSGEPPLPLDFEDNAVIYLSPSPRRLAALRYHQFSDVDTVFTHPLTRFFYFASFPLDTCSLPFPSVF